MDSLCVYIYIYIRVCGCVRVCGCAHIANTICDLASLCVKGVYVIFYLHQDESKKAFITVNNFF